jgi:hypothetical protein
LEAVNRGSPPARSGAAAMVYPKKSPAILENGEAV